MKEIQVIIGTLYPLFVSVSYVQNTITLHQNYFFATNNATNAAMQLPRSNGDF